VLLHLRNVGGITNEDLLCVAVLHDVLEETKTSRSEIEKLTNARVLDLVIELTRREPSADEIKGKTKDQIWKMRAQMLIEEIASMSEDAQRVKLADRLANVREAKRVKSPRKLERYFWQTFQILKAVPVQVNAPLWHAIRAELPEREVAEPLYG